MGAEKGLQTAKVGLEKVGGQIARAIPPAQLRRAGEEGQAACPTRGFFQKQMKTIHTKTKANREMF